MQFRGLILLIFGLAQALLAVGFTNPIKEPNGSDPFMVRSSDIITYAIDSFSYRCTMKAITVGLCMYSSL
jgi:hypothetical protein